MCTACTHYDHCTYLISNVHLSTKEGVAAVDIYTHKHCTVSGKKASTAVMSASKGRRLKVFCSNCPCEPLMLINQRNAWSHSLSFSLCRRENATGDQTRARITIVRQSILKWYVITPSVISNKACLFHKKNILWVTHLSPTYFDNLKNNARTAAYATPAWLWQCHVEGCQ